MISRIIRTREEKEKEGRKESVNKWDMKGEGPKVMMEQ